MMKAPPVEAIHEGVRIRGPERRRVAEVGTVAQFHVHRAAADGVQFLAVIREAFRVNDQPRQVVAEDPWGGAPGGQGCVVGTRLDGVQLNGGRGRALGDEIRRGVGDFVELGDELGIGRAHPGADVGGDGARGMRDVQDERRRVAARDDGEEVGHVGSLPWRIARRIGRDPDRLADKGTCRSGPKIPPLTVGRRTRGRTMGTL